MSSNDILNEILTCSSPYGAHGTQNLDNRCPTHEFLTNSSDALCSDGVMSFGLATSIERANRTLYGCRARICIDSRCPRSLRTRCSRTQFVKKKRKKKKSKRPPPFFIYNICHLLEIGIAKMRSAVHTDREVEDWVLRCRSSNKAWKIHLVCEPVNAYEVYIPASSSSPAEQPIPQRHIPNQPPPLLTIFRPGSNSLRTAAKVTVGWNRRVVGCVRVWCGRALCHRIAVAVMLML
jgi:hypothetical protein